MPARHWNQEFSSIWERTCSTAHMSDLCRDAWQVEMSQSCIRMKFWAARESPYTVARCRKHYTHLKMDGRQDTVKFCRLCHKIASFYLQYGLLIRLLPRMDVHAWLGLFLIGECLLFPSFGMASLVFTWRASKLDQIYTAIYCNIMLYIYNIYIYIPDRIMTYFKFSTFPYHISSCTKAIPYLISYQSQPAG